MTAQPTGTSLWIRQFHPAPDAATRLVCLPHAGGSASYFFPVSKALSPKVDVLAVQYPGRQDRRNEKCFDSIRDLADALVPELLPWTDKPLALFGHSMGATLGFEVALRLEQKGVVPVTLFASGRRAPSAHRDETVHQRDDEGLIAEVKSLSGTDSQLLGDDEILRMVLPAIRSDYKAAETYRYLPGPRLAAPIQAHVGTSDPKATVEEARAWSEHTTGDFALHTYPGGHFYLNSQASGVIASISEVLSSPPS
ncbi:thioesterase [Streptomyces sp. NA02950]|uniref:thioesterase II family protein n=1 Tax=Streptomyces sp. NA02950 TaxID=2742137 RepID=UPI001590A6FF|nr:alpha/beta fold hydrolase [Streptomyces sp. NA02950]QKV96743.1 thioesterase [Streptomyces sp. NA02950]